MKGSEKQVSWAKDIVKESLAALKEVLPKADETSRPIIKASIYALENIEEWGLSAEFLIKAYQRQQLGVVSYHAIKDWLEDEALTSESFYNKCWDAAEL